MPDGFRARPDAPWRLGIDVGGTFTDVVLVGSNGAVVVHKSLSEPSNPAIGVMRALDGIAAKLSLTLQQLLDSCGRFVHGTTVATNVLLERKGAKVGLLTTAGFRDTLEIRRGLRHNMWNHRQPWLDVLVPRSLRLPVDERLSAAGAVIKPLDTTTVRAAAARFQSTGVEAVAVCFLHSFTNPSHERAAREVLRTELGGTYISLSSDVAPIEGEFERASTVVANAYVAPRVLPYLRELAAALAAGGLRPELMVLQSNGGCATLSQLADHPAALALSGPAAGTGSLQLYSALCRAPNLISIEIGGTSCDVTVMHEGRIGETESVEIAETLIALPSVEIHTVSTGGGSICGVDRGGLLYAGPEGAGAKPGPACYGFGGTRPTITDAQLALGRLRDGTYAGGALQLDSGLAEAAVDRAIAGPLGVPVEEAAIGMVRLAEQQIRQAIEKVSLERGLDPRKFVLVGCGGAGPLHVASVARRLKCRQALVPKLAGVFCAFGMCNSELRYDAIKAIGVPLATDSLARIEAALASVAAQAVTGIGAPAKADTRVLLGLDLKYAGQQWTLSTEVGPGALDLRRVRTDFERQYVRRFAEIQPDAVVEVVCAKAAAFTRSGFVELEARPEEPAQAIPADVRPVFAGPRLGVVAMPVLDGSRLHPGHWFEGPAVIEEETTTIFIGPGDRLEIDAYGNYLIHIAEDDDA